ncbi:hypothetical protein [Acaryochloris marina]|uniref:hypothetical protein n=1 Tax=Acaryochloris marina TaxID=155978 RepID=UPI001BAE9B8C|nr:hypothetical protein [Acaryochloris marina]QUY43150.1 hypothetical protein I1H34_03050 [Acaryochloris marina S15]
MVDLLNPALRLRDLRKLVEHHLHEVKWEYGVDETSEWILAVREDQGHYQKLTSWLQSKNIEASVKAILVDHTWSALEHIDWSSLRNKPERYFYQKDVLIVASDRSWVIEYISCQDIFRFGRWI